MSEQQRKETDRLVRQSLIEAGIGRAYHDRTLSDLGDHGVTAKEWLDTVGKSDVRSGRGWNIIGATARAYDTTMVLARGVHLKGIDTRIVSLRRLIGQIMNDGDLLPELYSTRALFVLDFIQVYPGNDNPMTGREVQEVESFLLERLDANEAVFLHAAVPLTTATWWSASFLQRVAETNRLLEVPK